VSFALLPLSIIVFVLFPAFPFAVMGLLLKASSCRARQFISGVPWAEISVQIRQTSKELVVQRGAQQRPKHLIFCAAVRIFPGSAATSSPEKPHLTP
jgi:hypothetical protein